MLNGQNFVVDLGEGESKYGFYTTRYVSAKTKSDAEEIVIASVKKLSEIEKSINNGNNDHYIIYAENIEEVQGIENDLRELELSWFKEAF